jgi:hypothetical protein
MPYSNKESRVPQLSVPGCICLRTYAAEKSAMDTDCDDARGFPILPLVVFSLFPSGADCHVSVVISIPINGVDEVVGIAAGET